MNPKTENILRKTVLAGAFLALLVPLLVTHAVPSVTFAKAAAFQIIVEAMAVPWLMLAATDRRYRPNWRSPIMIALTTWLVVTAAVSLFSVAPTRSFFSNPSRMMGVFNYAHYWLWLAMLASTLKEWTDWRRLLWWSNGAALAVDLVVFYQYIIQNAGRAAGTMGNPIYLSIYALMSFGLALALLTKEQKRAGRIVLYISLIAHALALTMSGTRGAILALAGMGLIWLILRPCIARTKTATAITLGTGLVLIGLTIGGLAALPWLRTDPGKEWSRAHLPAAAQRMLVQGSGDERLAMWHMAWLGFLEKPWTGWGLENFQYVFDQHFDPQVLVFGERWHDRVHNQHLEVLFATGFFGTLTYLAFWITLVFMLARPIFRRDHDRTDKKFRLALLMLTLGYAGQNLFNFDLPMSLMLFFLALALAVEPRPEDGQPIVADEGRLIMIGFSAAIAALIAAFIFNITPLRNAVLVTKGVQAKQYDQKLSTQCFLDAFDNNSWSNYDHRWWLSETLRTLNHYLENNPSAEMKTLSQLAAREFEKSNRTTPADAHVGLAAAYAYRMLSREDQTAADKAETFARMAVAASPNYPEGYEESAEISHFSGNYEEAIIRFEEAERRAFLGKDKGRIRMRMAVVYAKMGQLDETFRQLGLINEKAYPTDHDPRLALPLALAAPNGQPNQREFAFIDRLLKKYNSHPDVIGALILLNRKAGDQKSAATNLKAFSELYPDLAREFQEKYLK